jgi:hypothetical protein
MSHNQKNRRTFLKTAAVAPVTIPLSRSILLSQGNSSEESLAIRQHPARELEIGFAGLETDWDSVSDGLHCSFTSLDDCHLRDEVPSLENATLEWKGVAWRGERVNIPVVLWTKTGATQVRLECGDLLSSGGSRISKSKVCTRFVRYVASNLPYGSIAGDCEKADLSEAWLLPDVLEDARSYDLGGKSVRPVWLSVDVPSDARPGLYASTVELKFQGGVVGPLKLELEVQNAVLPEPSEWQFRLDIWQNPWAVAHQHNVEPWSTAHIEILKPHLKMLADAGAKFITTYVCHSPWKDDTYVADSTMVEWIRQPDGSWSFDYEVFDLYVELAASCGISDSITAYTMLPWKHRVRYLDAVSGNHVWEEWLPDSSQFKAFWSTFLQDFKRHLKNKGWFEKTYIGINENALEDTQAALRTLHEEVPEWKVTYAGHWHEELNRSLHDYCTIIDKRVPPEEVQRRRKEGKTSTFYVCCYPGKPNNYPFSPPAENTWMGWYAAALDLDGFLRWAYDSWTEDPLRDARHVLFPAGDCFLVYPGVRSSVRFERLREGIVDFEKIGILRKRLEQQGNTAAKEALRQLERTLALFDYERVQSEPAAVPVGRGKKLLDELTRTWL